MNWVIEENESAFWNEPNADLLGANSSTFPSLFNLSRIADSRAFLAGELVSKLGSDLVRIPQ
jgi:hypothetical protein